MTERHCVDCRHYQETRYPEPKQHCTALMGQLHPVTGGDIQTIDPGLMRMTLCGWRDPKFWGPKAT